MPEQTSPSGADVTGCPFEAEGFVDAYALGALDGEELRAFDAHLAACPICRAELARDRATVAQLGLTVEPAAPSPDLRARLLAALHEDEAEGGDGRAVAPHVAPTSPPREPARPATWPAARAYAVAAVLLLALGLGLLGWNLLLQGQVRQLRVERDQAVAARDQARAALATYTLSATAGHTGSGQLLYLPQQQQAILVVSGLPPLQPGQVYQVWLIQGGQPRGVGILTAPSGEAAVPGNLAQYQVVAVTVEPGPDGSPKPTTPPILAGQLGQQ
ncbi:MAG TPA: anti-sigma factor [Thermomicrobiales bacterium]|nr:anti-sigma factor [Thermomicrobiales bacterium]